jgi:hypothetical protein
MPSRFFHPHIQFAFGHGGDPSSYVSPKIKSKSGKRKRVRFWRKGQNETRNSGCDWLVSEAKSNVSTNGLAADGPWQINFTDLAFVFNRTC